MNWRARRVAYFYGITRLAGHKRWSKRRTTSPHYEYTRKRRKTIQKWRRKGGKTVTTLQNNIDKSRRSNDDFLQRRNRRAEVLISYTICNQSDRRPSIEEDHVLKRRTFRKWQFQYSSHQYKFDFFVLLIYAYLPYPTASSFVRDLVSYRQGVGVV
jgi:hypothetical protein